MIESLKSGAERKLLEPDAAVQATVAEILADVRRSGEDAVRRHSRLLDDWDPPSFVLSESEIACCRKQVSKELRRALGFAASGIRGFAEAQRSTLTDLDIKLRPGVYAGHRRVPVDHVAAYVPGGRFQLITSSLMTVIPARVAGVREVTAVIAPARHAGPSPAAVFAAELAGADRICSIGGVQALGALVYEALEGIPEVDVLVGAGNAYVAEAKRQLFGTVGIDLLAGPSEILVLADSGDPHEIALDLLSQAEHGPTSATGLIASSRELAKAVLAEIPVVLAGLTTAEVAAAAWRDHGSVVVASTREEMASLADNYAAEHVLLRVEDPEWFHGRLRNYGALFLNRSSSVVFGDKANGPNHTLPTLRAARYTGGLSIEKYLKTLTYQRVEEHGVEPLIDATAVISRAEGMEAHAQAADARRPVVRGG